MIQVYKCLEYKVGNKKNEETEKETLVQNDEHKYFILKYFSIISELYVAKYA